MRITRMLLVCVLLTGCGCIRPAPGSQSSCFGPGAVEKSP
jgi:hypothetical protein